MNIADQIDAESNLGDHGAAIGPSRAEQRRVRRFSDWTVQHEHPRQPAEIRRQQHEGESDQVKRDQLQADVVGHVQDEHLNHVGQRDRRAEHRRLREDQQDSGDDLRPSGEHLIADRRPDGGPLQVGSRKVADRFHQRDERRGGKLCRNDLGHSEIEHLSGQRETHEQTAPFRKRGVAGSMAVDERPDA